MSATVPATATTQIVGNETQDQQTLRLNEPGTPSRRGITWDTGVVDNENMGKKSSKCCCIYNKPKAVGESSSESEDSDDDTNSYEKLKKHKKRGEKQHSHENDCCPSDSSK